MTKVCKIVSPKTIHTMPLSLLHSLLKQPTSCMPDFIHHPPEFTFHGFHQIRGDTLKRGGGLITRRSSRSAPVGSVATRRGQRCGCATPITTQNQQASSGNGRRPPDGCQLDPGRPHLRVRSSPTFGQLRVRGLPSPSRLAPPGARLCADLGDWPASRGRLVRTSRRDIPACLRVGKMLVGSLPKLLRLRLGEEPDENDSTIFYRVGSLGSPDDNASGTNQRLPAGADKIPSVRIFSSTTDTAINPVQFGMTGAVCAIGFTTSRSGIGRACPTYIGSQDDDHRFQSSYFSVPEVDARFLSAS